MAIVQQKVTLQREVLVAEVVREVKAAAEALDPEADLAARVEAVAEVDPLTDEEKDEEEVVAENEEEEPEAKVLQRKLNLPKCWVCLGSLQVHEMKT